MTNPTASEVNAGSGNPEKKQFPQPIEVNLKLSLLVGSQEELDYFLAPGEAGLQLGFVADLFDLFNFEQEYGVSEINGISHSEIRRLLQPR